MKAHTIVIILCLLGAATLVIVRRQDPPLDRAIFAHESSVPVAEIHMQRIDDAIQLYRLRNKQLPGMLDELTQRDEDGEPYITAIPDDPWDSPYDYRIEGPSRFTLRSAGPDGQLDTDDDILHDTGR